MTSIVEIVGNRLPGIAASRPRYWKALVDACAEVEPPYGSAWYGELFRHWALDLDWLARLLVVNAQKEADGARKLWELAGRIEDARRRDQVRSHAIDESRHATFYIAMLEMAFPGAATADELIVLRGISPGYRPTDAVPLGEPAAEGEILDEVIQMNIGEVRTLINQMLMRPVLEIVAPAENRDKLVRVIDALGDDELAHVSYTASMVEDMASCGDVEFLMKVRMLEFAQITLDELGVAAGETPSFP